MAVPALSAYGPLHTILEGGGVGAWDRYLDAVHDVVTFNGTYYLFYVGFDSVRGDNGPGNRALGVATSTDGLNWIKSPSNPIITFHPAGEGVEDEEGVQGCACVVSGGKIHVYYGGLRHTGGSNVDTEIRYRESSDGHTYTNDTLIQDDSGNEISPIGAYVDGSGNFHLYWAGPLIGGVGDLKRLTGDGPTNLTSENTLTTDNYWANGNIVDYDGSNILITLIPNHGEYSQRLIAKSALGTLGAEQQLLDTGEQREGYGCAMLVGSQWFLFTIFWDSYDDPTGESRIVARCSPDIPAFTMSASANIAASAATATTAQLTAPSGKTTGDFDAARISDDTNPLPTIDITADDYTEGEWCIAAQAEALAGSNYEFRVTKNGTVLDSYAVTPEWEIPNVREGVGASSGTSTVSGISGADKEAVGSSSGVATVSAVASSFAETVGASSGVSSVDGVGENAAGGEVEAVGASSGSATVSGVSGADKEATGASSGTASVSGVGSVTAETVGSASGSTSCTGVSGATAEIVGSSSGVSSVAGVGALDAETVGASSAGSTVAGVASYDVQGVGASSGVATASGVGSSTAETVGASSGAATVSGVGQDAASGTSETEGSASGVATVAGVSGADAQAVGATSGVVTVLGAGRAVWSAVGSSSGSSTVSGVGEDGQDPTEETTGSSSGTSTVSGVGAAVAVALGNVSGVSTTSFISGAFVLVTGASSGVATVTGIGIDASVPVPKRTRHGLRHNGRQPMRTPNTTIGSRGRSR